jgi:hypothetical protein
MIEGRVQRLKPPVSFPQHKASPAPIVGSTIAPLTRMSIGRPSGFKALGIAFGRKGEHMQPSLVGLDVELDLGEMTNKAVTSEPFESLPKGTLMFVLNALLPAKVLSEAGTRRLRARPNRLPSARWRAPLCSTDA